MRPRTQIPMPEPYGTEFQNFDRFVRLVIKAKPVKKAPPSVKKPKAKA